MALDADQLIDELARVLKTGARSGDDLRTSMGRWLNMAFRSIAYFAAWDGMRDEQVIATVAAYSTGTATFTLNSATVTGSGTTWTAAMVGRKIARTQGGIYYRVATYVSATQITIAEVYAEATASASTYVIYQDEYDLATTTHSIESANLIDAYGGPELIGTEQRYMDRYGFSPAFTGRPFAYSVATSTTVGTPRIRLTPTPDAIYRISFRYLKTWTTITGSDLYTAQGLPEDVEELAIDRALRWAPRIQGSRAVMPDLAWRRALREVWVAHKTRRYPVGQRHGLTEAHGPTIVFNAGGLS